MAVIEEVGTSILGPANTSFLPLALNVRHSLSDTASTEQSWCSHLEGSKVRYIIRSKGVFAVEYKRAIMETDERFATTPEFEKDAKSKIIKLDCMAHALEPLATDFDNVVIEHRAALGLRKLSTIQANAMQSRVSFPNI